MDLARRAAAMESIILLQGETGTGTELFAQAIHNGGMRRNHPFVPINCGAIPGELLESELFGYVDGAFTGAVRGGKPGKFEWANGGTILLDEIGDMPHDMQVKLLRVLQTKEVYRIGARKPVQVDTRIITSTHVDLEWAVREGRFRQDLFYRINVFPIIIPPLRDRGEQDILELTRFFLGRRPVPPALTSSVEKALTGYSWPGNVRELENAIQRAEHLCDGTELRAQDLGLSDARNMPYQWRPGTLAEKERETIRCTLEATGANMAASAKILGISRATLYRKFREYGL
jgi:transcriptional regulator with PAS, ATPase and Fis domain